ETYEMVPLNATSLHPMTCVSKARVSVIPERSPPPVKTYQGHRKGELGDFLCRPFARAGAADLLELTASPANAMWGSPWE
ncbi:hypothetical protein AVEN_139824-1, partial [Araneus ventricosus]